MPMRWPGMQDALLWGKYQTRRRGGFATSRPTQSTKPSLKAIPFDLTLYADFIFELTAPCQEDAAGVQQRRLVTSGKPGWLSLTKFLSPPLAQ
jgi:hypothetical protein